MKAIIQLYSAYDLWANTRTVERLKRESDAVLDRHVKSSFPSLRLTLNHVRDAGNTWHQRLFGQPVTGLGGGIDSLLKVGVSMNDAVRGLSEQGLQEVVTYATSKGERFTQPRWQLLLHCFNHASYHRGQVITIMRQLDLAEVPNTDLVAYERLLLGK